MREDIPDYLSADFPYPVTTREHYNNVDDGELWAWLLERNCSRRSRTRGDFEFWDSNTFLFKDERVAVEFKMRFG